MDDIQAESKVTSGMAASVPAAVRQRLGIEPGDTLVWQLHQDRLELTVKKAHRRGFDGFKPFDFGVGTHAAAEHDEVS